MSKKSIRFFNDREVRAVWDDENNCWWFSATDVVRAINNEPDYTKAGNYWRWLKRKLKQEGIQLVSPTHGFKFEAYQEYYDKLDKNSIEFNEKLLKLNASFELKPSIEKVFDFTWEIT